MNSDIQLHHPQPTKTTNPRFFKNRNTNSNCNTYLNYNENIFEDLSKLRGNSQNPQEKDDSFKFQNEPQSVDDFPEDLSELDDLVSL